MTGLGKIQKRVRRAFIAHPDQEFHTIDLVPWCYPRLTGKPQRKHRWAICVAAKRVAVRVRRDRPGGVVYRARASDTSTEGQL